MRGPLVGVALLVAAGLSVAVVPALRPTMIDGIATAVPVLGIPTVGDCVTEPIPYSSMWVDFRNPTGDTVTYPTLNIEPCDGPRYGEVVAVIPVPAVVTVEVNGNNRSTNGDPNRDRCWSASAAYLGMDTGPTADGQWASFLTAPSLVSGPLHAALTTGNQTDQLGRCGDQSPLLEVEPGSCGRPHRYQQLALAPGATGTKSATLTTTCTDTVNASVGRDITGTPDLEVVVTATDNYGAPTPISDTIPVDSSTLQCGVAATGGRLLAGSVIGLGDRPIPWA